MKKITIIFTAIIYFAFLLAADASAQLIVKRSNGEPYFNKNTNNRNNGLIKTTNRKYYSSYNNRPAHYYRHDNGKHKGWYKHKKWHKRSNHSIWRRR